MGYCCDRPAWVVLGRSGEGLWNFVQGKTLNVQWLVSCSVRTWKIEMLRAMQMMETSLLKFQRNIKRLYRSHLLFQIKMLHFRLAGTEEAAMVNKRLAPLKWSLCIPVTIDADQLELRCQWWLRREQHQWGGIFWKVFPRGQHTQAMAEAVSCPASQTW